MTHWAPPSPAGALPAACPCPSWPCPPASRLKRQWQDDGVDAQECATHGFTSAAAACPQPPRQRRRLHSGEPSFVLPTPEPQPSLAAQPYTQQCGPHLGRQQQQQQADMQLDLDLPPAEEPSITASGGVAGSSSDDDVSAQHPSRRPRTGTPGYRLMLPTPLPPAVGLAAPAWAQQLHSQAQSDAWALVPYAPSLAAQQPADRKQGALEEQRASPSGSQHGGGIQVSDACAVGAAAAKRWLEQRLLERMPCYIPVNVPHPVLLVCAATHRGPALRHVPPAAEVRSRAAAARCAPALGPAGAVVSPAACAPCSPTSHFWPSSI
jgi:hypothetical protein